jgi:FkbM family methyltransferase
LIGSFSKLRRPRRKNRTLANLRINNFLLEFAEWLEFRVQLFQGKGWGSCTVDLEVKAAASLLGSNPKLCIDVGGNQGLYSKALLSEFETKIVVFEPNKKNHHILREMFSGNAHVSVENLALSNQNSVATLHADKDGSGLASLTKRQLEHFGISFDFEEQVKTVRFEDYWRDVLGGTEIDLFKLDIEGHELAALDGLGKAINHIDLIQFEFGGCNIDTRTYFQDFWYFFTKNSFDVYRIGPLGLRKIQSYRERDEFFSTTNFYAKKRR